MCRGPQSVPCKLSVWRSIFVNPYESMLVDSVFFLNYPLEFEEHNCVKCTQEIERADGFWRNNRNQVEKHLCEECILIMFITVTSITMSIFIKHLLFGAVPT